MARGEKLKALKKRVGYITNMPRCAHCEHFRKSFYVLVNSLPRSTNPFCKLHEIDVRINAVCTFFAPDNSGNNPTKEVLDVIKDL